VTAAAAARPVHAHAHGVPEAQRGVEFKYACTLVLAEKVGSRATGEILVNPHYDFIIRRISWEFAAKSQMLPKVRIAWKDARRSYMDRAAFITAAFGMPGEEFNLVGAVRIDRGTTMTFEAISAQDEACEIDIVVHGIELRRPDGEA